MGFTKEKYEEYKERLKIPKKIRKEQQRENQRRMKEPQARGEYFEHPGYWSNGWTRKSGARTKG
jgi:hypothetical protein